MRLGSAANYLLAFALALPAVTVAADRGRGHAEDARALPPKTDQPLDRATMTGRSYVAREGGGARQLWIDSDRVVEFPAAGGRPTIRAARPDEVEEARRSGRADAKASPRASGGVTPAVSPLFKDPAGQPRALPGGVIVGLKEALPDDEAGARLAADGLVPVRRINARMWLVEAPVGIASLDLADRLHESGRYDFAQPNWWKPRVTK